MGEEKLVKGIRSYFKKSGFKKAVIGLSGGVDSSLSAFLVAKALGASNVLGLLLPEKGVSSKLGVEHAKQVAEMLGIGYEIIPINEFLVAFDVLEQSKLAELNTKARIRANILYNYANSHNALVIGTSNKTELKLGFFTKHGDGACDLEVIGSLYKTQVFAMANELGVPEGIISKAPSAELYKGHTDEKELGLGYDEIDKMLMGKKALSAEIKQRIKNNKHKTELVPIIR